MGLCKELINMIACGDSKRDFTLKYKLRLCWFKQQNVNKAFNLQNLGHKETKGFQVKSGLDVSQVSLICLHYVTDTHSYAPLQMEKQMLLWSVGTKVTLHRPIALNFTRKIKAFKFYSFCFGQKKVRKQLLAVLSTSNTHCRRPSTSLHESRLFIQPPGLSINIYWWL